MLVQVDNRNIFKHHPSIYGMSAEQARNMYGEQIEGEKVNVTEDNGTHHLWIYTGGRYVGE